METSPRSHLYVSYLKPDSSKSEVAVTRGIFFTRIKHELSENGWAELRILSRSIIPHLSSLK